MDRITTVRLLGGGTLTVPCPDWCSAEHRDGERLADFGHLGSGSVLMVPTWLQGDGELLDARLVLYPFGTHPVVGQVYASAELGGEACAMRPTELLSLAPGLRHRAGEFEQLAQVLDVLRGEADR